MTNFEQRKEKHLTHLLLESDWLYVKLKIEMLIKSCRIGEELQICGSLSLFCACVRWQRNLSSDTASRHFNAASASALVE